MASKLNATFGYQTQDGVVRFDPGDSISVVFNTDGSNACVIRNGAVVQGEMPAKEEDLLPMAIKGIPF